MPVMLKAKPLRLALSTASGLVARTSPALSLIVGDALFYERLERIGLLARGLIDVGEMLDHLSKAEHNSAGREQRESGQQH